MQSYREILQSEFKKRVAKNRRFTLRAYAQWLELNSGSLSSILKGKRSLPRTHWQLCCDKLNLSSIQKTDFLSSLAQEFKLQSLDFQNSEQSKPNTLLVADNQVAILSEWEYAAVLSLMDITGFQFGVLDIQTYLDISAERAEQVFNQLLVARLVEFRKGQWQKCFENFKTTKDVQSRALSLGHENEMRLAQTKLTKLPLTEREFYSLTFAGSSKEMRKMKIWLRKMVHEFDQKFEKKSADQAFLFSIQLFPVSKKVKK